MPRPDGIGKGADRLVLVERGDRSLDVELGLAGRDEPQSQKGVPAGLEEVLVDPCLWRRQ